MDDIDADLCNFLTVDNLSSQTEFKNAENSNHLL